MQKMNTLTIIGLALIFIGGIGAILLTIGQSIGSQADKSEIINTAQNENKDLRIQLTEIKNERDKLNASLEARDKRIQGQNQNIESLSNKLVEKSEYIEEFMTGKNRYPYIEMKRIRGDSDKLDVFSFSVENSFEFPIYNIQIQVFDYEKIVSATYIDNEKKKSIKMGDYLNAIIFEYKTDEIPSREFRMSDKQYTNKSGIFFIEIHSRSKSVIQKIVLVEHGNNSYAGYIVIDNSGNILKENIYNNPPNEIQSEIKDKFKDIPNFLDLIFTKWKC